MLPINEIQIILNYILFSRFDFKKELLTNCGQFQLYMQTRKTDCKKIGKTLNKTYWKAFRVRNLQIHEQSFRNCLIIIFNNRFKSCMGQKNSETLKNDNIELDNWIEAVEDPAHSLFNGVNPFRKRLLVNKNTKELIEEYELQFLNQEDFTCYSKDIELRKEDANKRKIQILSNEEVEPYRACPYIYKVKYFTNTSIDELCTTIYNGLLYISKVELRLKEINDIPLNDQLYLYQCCLEGFKVLYEQVGYFDITEQMIFFNQEGKVKVWMNPNLSKHHPNYEPGTNANSNSTEIQGSQSEMLRNLINLIEQNTDLISGDRNIHFREYLKDKGIFDRLSFYKAIDEFHMYIEEYNLSINNYMKSIYDLFHHDEEHNDNLYRSQSQKSEVERVKMHKDYESLKNSSHELSFQKLNNSNYDRLVPAKFNQPSPLEVSRASKNSYNSEYNMRKMDSYSKLPKMKNSAMFRTNQGATESAVTYNTQIPRPRPFYSNQLSQPPITTNSISRPDINRGITFCPPEKKVFQQEPLIVKYRSLEKAPAFISTQNRPITFSYQNQQTVSANPIQSRQFLPATLNSQSETARNLRKQSIIDKLNAPAVLHTINNIKTEKTTPFNEPVTNRKNSQVSKDGSTAKNINYFSTTEAFMLDSEIAEDMMKYLGFNPNLI